MHAQARACWSPSKQVFSIAVVVSSDAATPRTRGELVTASMVPPCPAAPARCLGAPRNHLTLFRTTVSSRCRCGAPRRRRRAAGGRWGSRRRGWRARRGHARGSCSHSADRSILRPTCSRAECLRAPDSSTGHGAHEPESARPASLCCSSARVPRSQSTGMPDHL